MERFTYQIVTSIIEVEDKVYETYGIRCLEKNEVLESIEDISIDGNKIKRLVKTLNDEQLDPAQLPDVIEDIL